MIDLIVGIFFGIKNLLYYGLLLSYEIGKLLVKLIQISWFILRYVYEICQTLATVICEDFIIFLYDVYEHISYLLQFFNSTFGSIHHFTTLTSAYVKYFISQGREIISTSLDNLLYGNLKIFGFIGQLFIGIKHLFILFGSGVWFLLTLIPLGLIYSFSICTYYIGSCIDELVNLAVMLFKPILKFIQDIIDFTFDVPFEATAGLIAGGCIIYVMVKFHMIAYIFLKVQICMALRYVRCVIRSNLGSRHRNLQTIPIQLPSSPHQSNGDTSRSRDIYCVICQEREKCILILPCKHMCLCSECKDQLYRYHSRCPICRSYVHRTMKVFV